MKYTVGPAPPPPLPLSLHPGPRAAVFDGMLVQISRANRSVGRIFFRIERFSDFGIVMTLIDYTSESDQLLS